MTTARFLHKWVWVPMAVFCTAGALHACRARAPATTQDDVDGVRTWVGEYEQTWNTHDASALAAYFSEDADLIVGNGPRIVGRDAVEEWWRAYFSGIADTRTGTFAVVSLRRLTPEVVVIDIDSTTAGRSGSGEALPTRLARGTWVVTRHDGKWQISAFRALPAEGDVRAAPGRDR